MGSKGREGGEERKEREKGKKNIFSFLSKIYESRTVAFHQSKRQIQSTHRELRVGTKIFEFRQTPQGREFSYLGYFQPKGHLMAWGFSYRP